MRLGEEYSLGMHSAYLSTSRSTTARQAHDLGFGKLISTFNTNNHTLSNQGLKNDLFNIGLPLNRNLLQVQQTLYRTSVEIEFVSRVTDAATHAMRKLQSGN